MNEPFELFHGRLFSDIAADLMQSLSHEIAAYDDEYLRNVNNSELAQFKASQYSFKPLVLKFDRLRIQETHADSSAESCHTTSVRPRQPLERSLVRYQIPFEGDARLLHCVPDPKVPFVPSVKIVGDCVCFDVTIGERRTVETAAEAIMDAMRRQYLSLSQRVTSYNVALYSTALTQIERRSSQLRSADADERSLFRGGNRH